MDIKKVLLLGGSGFVGTYIANRLSQRGIEVTVPTRRRERTKNSAPRDAVKLKVRHSNVCPRAVFDCRFAAFVQLIPKCSHLIAQVESKPKRRFSIRRTAQPESANFC